MDLLEEVEVEMVGVGTGTYGGWTGLQEQSGLALPLFAGCEIWHCELCVGVM